MDFYVTKKKDGLDPQPEGAPDDKGALWLVLTCSQTGYLGVVPIQGKGQINYMTHEVLSFVQSLGCAEVGFYGDNEPTIRQILKTIITSRHALGLKTRIFTTKVKDSAGNSLAENSIQRIRQLACTLVEDVAQKTGLSYPCEHPLWSWAGRHAAWCLNLVGRSKNKGSTSSAVHCLNGIVVYHSSRGQRVVSLSSAEAELHGLVGGADGIALRIYLQFLLDEEEIQHVCLIDNSATKQISNKLGTGKLRHVSGKLLWIQDQASMKVLEVKQISTLLNIGDIGTKPLGKGRLYALMCWCNFFTKERLPVGEEEIAKAKATHYNKTSVMRISKLIQRVVLIGGLEQASGELVPFRMDLETVEAYKERSWTFIYITVSLCGNCSFLLLAQDHSRSTWTACTPSSRASRTTRSSGK